MTNITLSIDDDVYKRMKQYSEIRWSDFVRKAIEQRLNTLDKMTEDERESLAATLVSIATFRKDWENPYDERWDHV